MLNLFHHLVQTTQIRYPDHIALQHKTRQFNYTELQHNIEQISYQLISLGLAGQDRVAVYLGQSIESVISFFAVSACGAIFVPVNPHLKSRQIEHIFSDCTPKVLITSTQRYQQLGPSSPILAAIDHIILLDALQANQQTAQKTSHKLSLWSDLMHQPVVQKTDILPIIDDTDTVAILYTSGSTGKAKGVMLSHKNLLYGARSVASYLKNNHHDKILAVLPFSFDYGLSQLTTVFYSGACVVLLEYLLPRDVIKAVVRYQITGLAGVPSLWIQLAGLKWPDEAAQSLRYFTNSGGVMPAKTLQQLRRSVPDCQMYLMYGLTEAFRSTYLEPQLIDQFPDSIGKAIPDAEILMVNKEGKLCAAGEIGELVHCGPLVAKGYWNNKPATAETFRPVNYLRTELSAAEKGALEYAVWSGDLVTRNSDGFFYFVERSDAMIKSSGYRISPTEVEEVFLQHEQVINAAAIGVPHAELGQAIVLVCSVVNKITAEQLISYAQHDLPKFMCPKDVIIETHLPQTVNGKIDRQALSKKYIHLYE